MSSGEKFGKMPNRLYVHLSFDLSEILSWKYASNNTKTLTALFSLQNIGKNLWPHIIEWLNRPWYGSYSRILCNCKKYYEEYFYELIQSSFQYILLSGIKKCKRPLMVCNTLCRKEWDVRKYTCICTFVEKKHRMNKPESREIGYLSLKGGWKTGVGSV